MDNNGQVYLPEERNKKRRKNVPLRILVIALILLLGAGVALYLKKSAPVAGKAQPKKQARLVDVESFETQTRRLPVPAHGQVIAARHLSLSPEVSGRIVELNPAFETGARLRAGALVCRIDPRDYAIDVALKEAALQKAQAALEIEQGQQRIARTEWEMYQQGENGEGTVGASSVVPSSPDLVLRKPELQQAQAEVENARAALEQARLNLERTEIRIPFDALVVDESIEEGSYVSAQGEIATMAGTDRFWITATVSVADLQWVDMDGDQDHPDARVRVHLPNSSHTREGQIVRLLGNLSDEGRMAQILVEVTDPLDLDEPPHARNPLLLGAYLQLDLPGKEIKGVTALPRAAVHNGNQVWIATPEGTLDVREIEPLRRTRDKIYIQDGLDPEEKVITSTLAYAVEGMAVKENAPIPQDKAAE
ncbi:MAG: efflux RND transporter periplasmic adaptor subunit [Desulfuromonadaceae bacterium]